MMPLNVSDNNNTQILILFVPELNTKQILKKIKRIAK